ncbi:rust resistance kinase Lr10-like isoform X2 [Cornus florida]|uniref:rust resistance kinase Lr10-like isoform X2 n=1 Tax=Cornus florida TaxID=4283 RepID=UPI0028A2ADD8|nr:rust resistance kinase Lr10-like isoform X2 [Cornus florida]
MLKNSLSHMSGGRLVVCVTALVLLILQLPQINSKAVCEPSSCGNILNITHPFRLKGDPPSCGDTKYELVCENNLSTLAFFHSNKYYVQAINYHNFTIRLVDAHILLHNNHNCSSLPRYSFTQYNLSFHEHPPYTISRYPRYPESENSITKPIIFLSCPNPLDSPLYVDLSPCMNIGGGGGELFASSNSSTTTRRMHSYAYIGHLKASSVMELCSIDLIFMTSLPGVNEVHGNLSFAQLQSALLYGFELFWFMDQCGNCTRRDCYLDQDMEHLYCSTPYYSGIRYKVLYWTKIGLNIAMRILCGIPFGLTVFIKKLRRRHLSMFDDIEDYLQNQNNLTPIRYSYSQIKKMTNDFKDKLGEGGYGTVYEGKLRSGSPVAIKLLSKPKANGQEFINEVATIGRIHHVNVVQLVGYCAERSKRALVYDFMSNGSLEKYIFSREGETPSLSYEKMFKVSIGVARGIEYLHRGCDIQILHFDIKPHNILLDENFTPKVSDFGLAKLYPTKDSIVSLTAARGTMGYMAPELFYKSIGGVSYKADVYSFGMLLLEMTGRRKNLNAFADHSSQVDFPSWVYDQIIEGKDIEIGDANEEERKVVERMIIVGLWCIQMKPSDRPSMTKVVEMLEGNGELMQMPPKPFLYPEEMPEDTGINTEHSIQLGDSIDSITLDISA